jgi:hypothetical protein
MKNKNTIQKNKGAAMMIVVLFFMFISLTILIGVITPVVREFKIVSDNFDSKQSYFLAESGVEDILIRIRNNDQYDTSETLVLGTSSATTTITDISGSQKEIVSLGDIDSIQRKVNMTVNTGVGVSFSYGVLSGQGGFSMDNNSKIIGSVYSNGNITGSGSITGSATSANSGALTSDQSNGSGIPPYDITFGNANGTQDFAQSFQISTNETINKVQLYIKKVTTPSTSFPSNLTVRITNNSGGNPGATITQGTLAASLVSNSYGWVEVPFSTNPQLSAGTTYWLVVDGITSSTKYYKIGANSDGYANGVGKIGQYSSTWNTTTPSGLDGYFNLFIGGILGSISGVKIGEAGVGNAYAHTINSATVAGIKYCQSTNNSPACDTSRADPVQISMPISEQNIQDWKDAAEVGGTYTGNYNVTVNSTIGPKKITGNLTLGNSKILTMGGTIWVQGNLFMDNNSILKLASSYGISSGVIVVDGTITIQNNSTFCGSNSDCEIENGSYILALSTSNSTSAITLANNGGAVSLYAANGTIDIANNGTAKSLTGYNIHLSNNAVITYDEGLANVNFVSGPSGSWNISGWEEVQ